MRGWLPVVLLLGLALAGAGCSGPSPAAVQAGQDGLADASTTATVGPNGVASAKGSQDGSPGLPAAGDSSGATAANGASTPRSEPSGPSGPSGSHTNHPPAISSFSAPTLLGVDLLKTHLKVEAADPDGDPLTFELQFGDLGPTAKGKLPSAGLDHVYRAGNWNATLTVKDPDGASDVRQLPFHIRTNRAPFANLTVDSNGATFEDASAALMTFHLVAFDPDPEDAASLHYRLTFGDGVNETGTFLGAGSGGVHFLDLQHRYDVFGAPVPKLVVDDGRTISNVTGIPGGSLDIKYRFTGTAALPCPKCVPASVACAGFTARVPSVDCVWAQLPPFIPGRTYTLTASAPILAGVWTRDSCDPGGHDLTRALGSPAVPATPQTPGKDKAPAVMPFDGAAQCVVLFDAAAPTSLFSSLHEEFDFVPPGPLSLFIG